MIFSNLRHDNRWSRDNFSNQITDADKARRFDYNYSRFVDL
jgi:hypothetical protein